MFLILHNQIYMFLYDMFLMYISYHDVTNASTPLKQISSLKQVLPSLTQP